MKNTNKFLTASVALAIALFASVQVSAMNNNPEMWTQEEAESVRRTIVNMKDHLKRHYFMQDPATVNPIYRSHQEAARLQMQDEINQLQAEYNEYLRRNR